MANANSATRNQRFSPYNVKQGQARARQAQDLSSDGAIALIDGVVTLSKGSIGAYTIPVPAQTSNTGVIIITSTTAFAHVITQSTVGFNGKGSSGTLTFGGAAGDSVILLIENGNYYVVSKVNVTPA